MPQYCRYLLAAALTLPLVSCVEVVMRRPLSDESTSVFDEQLLGSWKFADGDPADRQEWTTYIGRAEGPRSTVKIVGVGLHKELKTVDVDSSFKRAYSRVGKNRYLSVFCQDKNDSAYLIVKYDFPDDRTLRFVSLRPDPIAKAIVEGKLRGRVGSKQKGDPWIWGDQRWAVIARRPWEDPRTEDVELTDTPDAIVQFLDEHERECFPTEDARLMKRIP